MVVKVLYFPEGMTYLYGVTKKLLFLIGRSLEGQIVLSRHFLLGKLLLETFFAL